MMCLEITPIIGFQKVQKTEVSDGTFPNSVTLFVGFHTCAYTSFSKKTMEGPINGNTSGILYSDFTYCIYQNGSQKPMAISMPPRFAINDFCAKTSTVSTNGSVP